MEDRTIKLTLEYDGSCFSGWQIQPNKKTVQQTVQDALQRITQENVKLVGASRTDAGVHALAQAAHFRTKSPIRLDRLRIALNGLLPTPICVTSVEEVSPDFHAIRGAKTKTYRYVIWNSPARPALQRLRVWHVWDRLNLAAMRKAASCLVGKHDFSAFRGAQSDTKTSVRHITAASVRKKGREIHVELSGNGFLKYMVRNIVGTLVEIGRGKRAAYEIAEILKSGDRKKAGATAPAFGLYLMEVVY